MRGMIPLRPDNPISGLNQDEMSVLTWFVISGCSRKDAFITFGRPDLLSSKNKAAIDDYVKQFFSRKEVKDYLDVYKQTLDEFLHPKPKEESKPVGSLDERKAQAKAKATEFAIAMADNIDQADDPEFVLKLMDKVGILDGDEQVEEQPRRYLPECCQHCAYRMFCEENTEDMCQYCKYHAFGEENGIHYEKENMLDVPLNSGTELAEQSE